MQISSSVSSVYLKSGQGNRNVKNSAEYRFREDSESDKPFKPLGTEERLNYKKPYSVWMEQRVQCVSSQKANVSEDSMESVSMAEYEEEGEFLGITMVPEEGKLVTYGMSARLLYRSSPDNPIVQVTSNLGGKEEIYNVEIRKINPQNATQLEMFALLSYADKKGLTDGGTFGSYQQLKVYAMNASHNGYCDNMEGGDVFMNGKFNWSAILEKMMKDYLEGGIDKQYEACKKLMEYISAIT